jgi:hypothetical protein
MNRWSVAALDMDDALNRTIWNESPGRQMRIFSPCSPKVGMVAAAQAFVEPPPLPWVPDLVGRNWRERNSVLIVGISYADFFLPLPGRRTGRYKRMQLSEYREASGPAAFQAAFLERVVRGDTSYYEPIADLLEGAGVELERTVITDICRASFGCWDGTRIVAGTKVLQNYDAVFRPYVHENQDWHNSRLDEGGFEVIVTLGSLAAAEVERWLRGRGWRERGPGCNFTSPSERVVSVLRAPHPNARGERRPADVAATLRELFGADTLSIATPKPDVPRGNEHQKARDAVNASTLSETVKNAPIAAIDAEEHKATLISPPTGEPIAIYNATRLLFRKAVIESLRIDESFQVNTPAGNFQFTKQEFYKSFPGVVRSRSYQVLGVYHYPKVPKQAQPFRIVNR